MNRTAGSLSRRRRLFGAGSTATRESPDARTSSSRHAPSFAFTSSKTRRWTQPSRRGRRVPGGAGVSGRVAETAVGDAGEEDENTLTAANNYAFTLARLNCQKEAKSVLRRTMPVARRILGENLVWLQMRWCYAKTLCEDPTATLGDLREAVTTLEDTELTARRVLGGTHPVTAGIGEYLQKARPVRDARETPPGSA